MCQACDSKLATHHISQPGSNPPSISLCGNCAETHVPAFADVSAELVREAGCCYCGGVATSGAVSSPVETESRFICQSCAGESARLFLMRLVDRGLSLQDLQGLLSLPQFGAIFKELEEDMRRWVIQRDN